MICALVMAGGKGTRFWPLSTEKKPKQFLKLLGNRTMIQMTIDRIKSLIPIDNIFICTVAEYVDLVKEQIPELPEENIIVEPEGKNTAPCIALASMIISRKYKDVVMAVLPSDHLIKDELEFRKLILECNEFLNRNKNALITIGIKPDRPETGYGYIRSNENFSDKKKHCFYKVEKFVEKPDIKKARKYIKDGGYLWNSGMFLWRTAEILNQVKEYCPSIYENLKDVQSVSKDVLNDYINEKYAKTESISIDYAILEHSKNVYVVKADMGWDDIGTWKAVERYKKKDLNNNIVSENTHIIESKSNITINNEKKVIMIGINNVLTIETKDSIYIINKNYMDKLRDYKKNI